MPIEFFLPDRLVQELITKYNGSDANTHKGLLFTVDFVQDEKTHIYGAKGTVDIAGSGSSSKETTLNANGGAFSLCPHPPPCG